MKDFNKIINNFWNKQVKDFYKDTPSEYLYDFFNEIKKRNIKNVLDIGCGAGRNTEMIYKLGYKVYGCDLNKKMVIATKKRLPLKIKKNIIISDTVSLPYIDNFFDFIISNGVFHNAKNFKDFCLSIKEASRVLKNNGYFVLNTFIYGNINGGLVKNPKEKHFYLTKEDLPIILLPTAKLIKILSENNLLLISFKENYVTVSTGERRIFKGVFIKTDNAKNKDVTLSNLRTLIDPLDKDILKLISKRIDLVKNISEYKKKRGLSLSDYKREKEIKDNLLRFSNFEKLGLNNKKITDAVNFLLKISKN